MTAKEKIAAKAASAASTGQERKCTAAEVANERRRSARQARMQATEDLKRAEALHSQMWQPLLNAVETAFCRCGGVTILGSTSAARFLEVLEDEGFEVVERDPAHG